MKIYKLSIAVLFLSGSVFYAQEKVQDTVRKEKKIEGVVIQGSTNKKTETAVLGEQKRAIIQKQAISAEEISRKGISNVEQGLTKVTGITTVDGRGLFVRGLEERYNYLLINGLGTPSNNPFQKIIALKQFPTDVVGKLNIYKTFNSNLYGDFAGATFDIETLTIDRSFSKIEFGIGVNTLSTFKDGFKVSEGADGFQGYLGLNSDDRKLPSAIRNSRPNNYRFTANESISQFNDSWNVDNIKPIPNTSIGFTTVQKVKAGETGSLGILFSLNQSSEYSYKEGAKNQFKDFGGVINLNNDLQRKQYGYELESSALLGFGYKNKGTNINLNAMFLQNANNIIEDYTGYKNNQVQNKDIGFFRTNQQDLSRFLNIQLTGSQKLGERQSLKAGASYVINNYSQPDRKIIEGSRQDLNGNMLPDNQLLLAYGGNNIIRQYLDVNSRFYGSAYGEYSVFLGEKGERKDYPMQLSVGYNGFADMRKTSYRFLFGKPNGTAGQSFLINKDTPQDKFNQDLNNNLFFFQEETDPSLFFTSMYQFVNAGYVNFNFKPTDTWDILVGGRYENDMTLIRFSPQGAENKTNLSKERNLFLPSLAIKNAVTDRSNLRFAFSKTVTRPVLIETMAIQYINPDNETITGNPLIKISDNYNFDLKWEYFPSNKELISVNLFAKRINNAIERSFVSSGDANGVSVTFFNAKKADIAGIELEGIFSLGRLSEDLSKFSLGANATFMYSDVERSQDQLNLEQANPEYYKGGLKKRGLQGASPYTINADLKYETKTRNNFSRTLSLVYNVSGSKIYAVGTSGSDNFYEKPFHQLDFIYQEQLDKNWNVKAGVANILNTRYRIMLGDESSYNVQTNNNYTYTDYFRGINFNLTVGYTF
nr:outer membrane beta-barrel protein [uncultured Chryseobacterium sp.]